MLVEMLDDLDAVDPVKRLIALQVTKLAKAKLRFGALNASLA